MNYSEITEKELEDVIFYQQFQDVFESGLGCYMHAKVVRQLSLGSFGIPDLLGFDFYEDEGGKLSEVVIRVYELKKGHVSFEALSQGLKYQYALRQLFINNPYYKDIEISTYLTLIGHSIESSVDFMAAAAEIEASLYTYELNHKGIEFNHVRAWQYKPDDYERTWFGDGKRLNLFKLYNGSQDVVFDPIKNESWISNQ